MSQEKLTALGKKILSLTLIFSSIASLVSSLSVTYGVLSGYVSSALYKPYLIDTSLLFFAALTGILNIAPARIMGKVNVKRVLFHHYVYGFLSILTYFISAALSPILYLFSSLNPYLYDTQVNQVLMVLLLYWGITLVIDDISDISPRIERLLGSIGNRIRKISKMILWVHLVSSIISTYATISVFLWYFNSGFPVNGSLLTDFAHVLFIASLSLTTIYGLKMVWGRVWLKRF
ncbi:hypothetical protein KEJ17_03190 [Candidatus Bathyarchaeota archaeon]|nr:hypothetical protein [Candidatus Bathyarchaeota archaeon]